MIPTVRQRDGDGLAAAIDIAPLIDVVFILLLFFLVTSSFVRETGVPVERPRASFTETLEASALRLVITAAGEVFSEGEPVALDAVRERVRHFVAGRPRGAVVLVPDRRTPAEALVRVMDAARAGGAERIALATLDGGDARPTIGGGR